MKPNTKPMPSVTPTGAAVAAGYSSSAFYIQAITGHNISSKDQER